MAAKGGKGDAKGGGGGGAKAGGDKDRFLQTPPDVWKAVCEKAADAAKRYPANWGELFDDPAAVPASLDETLATRRRQLEEFKARTGAGVPLTTIAALGASVMRPSPEAGLGKAYRILKAGT